MKKTILLLLLLLSTWITTGCSTSYNSASQNSTGAVELIVATENQILNATYEAITKTFPSAHVQRLAAPSIGFAWFVRPLLDRTDFRFLLTPRLGETDENNKVSGWSYNISTEGTQGLVEARYVNPLVSEIQATLKERNIKVVNVRNVIYAGAGANGSIGRNQPTGSGTGFFISNNGHIITSHHVIDGAADIEVITSDGKKFNATFVSADPSNDVALIKIDADSVPLGIASATGVKKGLEVFTLGYPAVGIQGHEQKATFGRVNALSGFQGDIRYFQIDVPIQPGNSGGPLISDEGRAIGIVTATLNQINVLKATGSLPQNVNYAVKSEYFLPLAQFAKIQPNITKSISGALKNPSNFEKSVVFIKVK